MTMSLFYRKKFLSVLTWIGMVVFSIVLSSCSFFSDDEEDENLAIPPNSGLGYWLYPNDEAFNDSAAANLTHGVRVFVHPNANYELSFDKDPDYSAPKLQLYRLIFNEDSTRYRPVRVRSLEPEEMNGRYVYSFTCEEDKRAIWATTLVHNRDYYKGLSRNVKLVGSGAYSDHFSINFVIVGKVTPTTDGLTAEEVGQKVLEGFRKYYSSVTIDTLYVRYASDHPTYGKKYPADEPWLAGRSSGDMFLGELGGWPEKSVYNALDVVYMHRIESEGIMGYARLFGGNLGGGDESTVIVGNRVLDRGNKEIPLSSEDVVLSVLHETGHFFGLRHTTSTPADFEATYDYSIYEDGIEDTPYCKNLLRGNLYKSANEGFLMKTDFAAPGPNIFGRVSTMAAGIPLSTEDCPDAPNYMFPADVDVETTGFSEQQLEIIRKNLMIFPH